MPLDASQFKTALSRWASSVAVITARDEAGVPVGLTATSFASLSLQPPLVLFCLGLDSTNHDALMAAPGFAVHILSLSQEALSNRFAARGGDKFADLPWSAGRYGAPLLEGCLAALECRTHSRLPGGDHVIVVGEVEAASVREGEPLLYHRGAYGRMAPGA